MRQSSTTCGTEQRGVGFAVCTALMAITRPGEARVERTAGERSFREFLHGHSVAPQGERRGCDTMELHETAQAHRVQGTHRGTYHLLPGESTGGRDLGWRLLVLPLTRRLV